MKKKISMVLLLLSIIILASSIKSLKAQEDIEPSATNPTFAEQFPDQNFALYLAEYSGYDINDPIEDYIFNKEFLDVNCNIGTPSELISDLSGIEVFTKLERVSINYCSNVKSLPDSFSSLSNLQSLELSQSKNFESLPENIGNLQNLRRISITMESNLTKLPDSIGNILGLTHIRIIGSDLSTLPSSIVNLENLELLELTDNKIVELPSNFGDMNPANIDLEIQLDWNQLTSIPNSIVNLPSNTFVNLTNNLLPNNADQVVNPTSLAASITIASQDQLSVSDTTPILIKSQTDLDNIDYNSVLKLNYSSYYLNEARVLSADHNYIFENQIDFDGHSVDLSEYIKNGVVQKNGSVFTQVRATGTGLFPNNSENAITREFDNGTGLGAAQFIELVFETTNYTLSFDLNGGEGAVPTAQSLLENDFAISVTDPTRQGYIFNGWNTVQDGSGMLWDFATQTMPANDVTLYAQWAISEHQLQFNLNGGEGIAPSDQTIAYGALATAPTNPIREGYTFKGWNTVQDGSGSTWVFETSTMPANDVTLYAQWEISAYQLQFNLNGGEGIAPSDQTIAYGALATAPTNPIREGYIFKGWNTVQDGSGMLWDFATQTMPANDVTLYAQWEKNSVPVVTANATQTYEQYSTVTAEQFLIDVAASMNEEGTLSSDFTTVVDLNVVGDNYQVTVSGVNQFGNTGVTTVNVIVVERETPNLVITANDVELTQKELADAVTSNTLESELLSRSGARIYDKITQEEYGPLMIKPADLQLVKETKVGSSQEISIIYEPSVVLALQDNKTDVTSSATQQVSTKIQVTIVGSENGTLVQTGENNVFAMIGIILLVVGSIILFFKSRRKYMA